MRSQFDDSALVIFANIVNDTQGVSYLIDQLESLKRFLFKDKEGISHSFCAFHLTTPKMFFWKALFLFFD